jgi:molybdate transport system ATP-binding protein
VRDNVAFGPRSSGATTRAARLRAEHWLREVDAIDFADRRPNQLSGGEAQRIAIARALAAEPKLLLLDEPLAALDVTVVPAIRRLLRRVLVGQTAVVVTHDVLDAYVLASTVAVVNAGRVVEFGATADVLQRPRSPFTAALVGLNLFTGVSTARGMRTESGAELGAQRTGIPSGSSVGATLSPSRIQISLVRPTDTGINALEGRIIDLEPRGDLVRVTTASVAADVSPATVAELDLVPGMMVWSSFPESELAPYAL